MRFPEDETGDALRRMYEAGADLLQTHNIELWHLFARQSDAEAMSVRSRAVGITADVDENDEVEGWDVRCVVPMVPTHRSITETELTLGHIAEECGGKADGWGVLME